MKKRQGGILVYLEHENGQVIDVSRELVAKARELGDRRMVPVIAFLPGSSTQPLVEKAFACGADLLVDTDRSLDSAYDPLAQAAYLTSCINDTRPSVVLLGATTIGRDLAPRVAARLQTGLSADCVDLSLDEQGVLHQIKPTYGGQMLAEIVCATARPQMATVRPHVFPLPDERQGRTQGETIRVVIEDSAQDQLVTVHEEVPEAGARCTLSRADVIVCGGRGLGDRETFSLCEELAELLGGATAATRPAVEQGWTDRAHQIGLSGMTVAPKLLITCGVAGAAPFVAGMQRAETVVAFNQDPEAPIFRTADYGIVGDARVVLPLLIKKLREPRLHK